MSPTEYLLALSLLVSVFDQTFCETSKRHWQDLQTYIPPRSNFSQILRQRMTRDAVLHCILLGNDTANTENQNMFIEWWYRGYGYELIGTFDQRTRKSLMNWSRDGAYAIDKNGTLTIFGARRELVERYDCVTHPRPGQPTLIHATYFRLDFSFWYDWKWDSLAVGSCLSALVFCTASFLLNIAWIICQRTVLWWIRRTERMSRVRAMITAMEKYRQKQMEALHETYNRRVSTIRHNYHNQVEQLRHSYTDSADRFRGQIGQVQHQLDSIRDNYNQQISKLREFGSRRVEQIWEGYDRSMGALRTFTLEQRLRIQNQYKVKQRYVNKLLEALAVETNEEQISKKEAAIREVLGDVDEVSAWSLPHPAASSSAASLVRSSSYYSLPELFIDEMDEAEGEVVIMAEVDRLRK